MNGALLTNCDNCGAQVSLDTLTRLRDLSCPHCRGQIRTFPNLSAPGLLVVNGDLQGNTIPLTGEVSFGRAPANTVTLREMKASRQHAIIKSNNSQYIIKDLKSANGTYVNDQLVSTRVLTSGDLLRIADSVFLFKNPSERVSVTSKLGARFKDGEYETQFEVKAGDDIEMLTMVGGAKATGELDARALQRVNEKLQIIYNVTNVIGTILDLRVLLERILDMVFEHIPAERGAIFLADDAGELQQRVVKKRGEEVEDRYLEISKTIIRKVINERTSVLTSDAMQDDNFSHAHSIISQGIRQAMSVPLLVHDEFLGLLHIDTTRMSAAFDQENLRLLTGIAGQASIAIQNAKLLERIEEETKTRAALSRYLAPELVDQVVNKQLDLAMGGQEKKVTLLFSDIRGFTPMSERIEAVDVVDVLNQYFEVMVDIIFKHGGMLDKFIGDAIMAVWGLPIDKGIDPLNAVRAGIEMQVQLYLLNYRLRREGREPIYMGVGINTGDVVSGNMGSTKRTEYTVIGRNVNLAARIESLTKRHQVLISESTYNEIRPNVRAIELEPTSVKGIEHPIRVFCVMGVVPDAELTDEGAERRTAGRVDVFFPAVLSSIDQRGNVLDGVIVDISSAGLALEVLVGHNAGIEVGGRWKLVIDIYGLFSLDGAVVRVERTQTVYQEGAEDLVRVGFSFDNIPEAVSKFFAENLFHVEDPQRA